MSEAATHTVSMFSFGLEPHPTPPRSSPIFDLFLVRGRPKTNKNYQPPIDDKRTVNYSHAHTLHDIGIANLIYMHIKKANTNIIYL